MGMIGSAVGTFAGGKLGKHFGGAKGEHIGKTLGALAGGLLPYKTGGRIKGSKKGKAVQIIGHVGEFVLPVGVKPTKHQKAEVAKRKKKACK